MVAKVLRIPAARLEALLPRGAGLWDDGFKAQVRAALAEDVPPAPPPASAASVLKIHASAPAMPAQQLDLFEVIHGQ